MNARVEERQHIHGGRNLEAFARGRTFARTHMEERLRIRAWMNVGAACVEELILPFMSAKLEVFFLDGFTIRYERPVISQVRWVHARVGPASELCCGASGRDGREL